ncbi:MAG: hypothetical protein KF727_15360 [Microbacteriaceae bacterium]|nr:hypothetical protein [Microbacteriaceae bacterium]
MIEFFSRRLDIDLSAVSQFRTEVIHPEAGRTDIEGQDPSGRPLLIIEAKFAAPLTDGQIARYLSAQEMAIGAGPQGLVLLVPDWRVELTRGLVANLDSAALGSSSIDVLSWFEVLDAIEAVAMRMPQGSRSLLADLVQLRDLVMRRTVDTKVVSAAIAGAEWQERRDGLERFVDVVTQTLADMTGVARGPQIANRSYAFAPAYYLRAPGPVPGTYYAVGLDADFSSAGLTPLWIRFHKETGGRKAVKEIRARLGESRFSSGMRFEGGHVWVPIDLPPDVAAGRLVERAVSDIREVLGLLDSGEIAAD